jgi:hypothetical protein
MMIRTCTGTAAAVAALIFTLATPLRAESVCADPQSHQFDFWLGEWEVSLREGGRIVGFNRITPILDGCVLQESWRGVSGSAGSSLNFYDTQRKRWRQLWVWREGTTIELEGTLRDGQMVMEGDTIDPDGKTVRNRITWFNNTDGTVRQFWEVSRDSSQTWTLEFEGIYRKRG